MNKSVLLAPMAVVLSAVPALADLAPPADYVETCTVAKQETASKECLACAAYYATATRCQAMLAPYCFSKVCKSHGASTWTEVHCRSKGAGEPAVPAEITSVLATATTPPPAVTYKGTCPSNALPKNIATATSTKTEPKPGKNAGSACSLATGRTVHTLGPWSLALAGLLLLALRRRRRH